MSNDTDDIDKLLELLSPVNLPKLTFDSALQFMGKLTDKALDESRKEALDRSIQVGEELGKQHLSDARRATLHYFISNAWANTDVIERKSGSDGWNWDSAPTGRSILHLRKALQVDAGKHLHPVRRCQVFTNLGNALSLVGRAVEAIDYWDRALGTISAFAMARGNKGISLSHYAAASYDKVHKAVILNTAHRCLKDALTGPLDPGATEPFERTKKWIESVVKPAFLAQFPLKHKHSLGKTTKERAYRKWCLENRLFLNPLNDLGPFSIGARDVLSTPSIIVGLHEGPYYQGFFNQMKQEFVSARYLYYEGLNDKEPHYSDRGVLLFNTLDYPEYSLASEKMKSAFRVAYSLFDKVAFFLNHYLSLGIPERQIYFRTFWFTRAKNARTLRSEFQNRKNWPLRGLFWLMKDLYDDSQEAGEALEPDAQLLAEIRNHLEHKYLKLHLDLWGGPAKAKDPILKALVDTLARSLYREDFVAKTLRLLKLARAALIYLSLAIHGEERERAKLRDPNMIVPPMFLDTWDDDWKGRL